MNYDLIEEQTGKVISSISKDSSYEECAQLLIEMAHDAMSAGATKVNLFYNTRRGTPIVYRLSVVTAVGETHDYRYRSRIDG